jgi:hypothetical protein
MDDPTTTATLDQADEDILTPTVSDEAIEAAAGSSAIIMTEWPPMIACAPPTLICYTENTACPRR